VYGIHTKVGFPLNGNISLTGMNGTNI